MVQRCGKCKLKHREETRECSRAERIVLNGLVAEGFSFIARDKDGMLYAYGLKPYKDCGMWDSDSFSSAYRFDGIDDDLFSFIVWEDEHPRSIRELLEYEECPW